MQPWSLCDSPRVPSLGRLISNTRDFEFGSGAGGKDASETVARRQRRRESLRYVVMGILH